MSRVKFTLKQNEGEYLKSWRVTDFANKISEIHYKHELLNEIYVKLQQGIEPQNIFVLDNSFSIHKTNKFVGIHKLNTKTGVKNLYHLGSPIPLYANHKIDAIYHIFGTFSNLYTEFNKEGIKEEIKLDKNRLYIFIHEAIRSENTIKFNKMKKYIERCVNRVSKIENREKLKGIISDEFVNLRKNYKESYDKQNELIKLDEKLFESNLSDSEKKDYVNFNRNVVGRFEYYFNTNKRPIVGVYDRENNTIEILCANFIKQSGIDDKQFNLKEISHNSPYLIIFIATYVLAQLFYQMYANKVDEGQVCDDEEEIEVEPEESNDEDTVHEETQVELALFEEIKERLGIILEDVEESMNIDSEQRDGEGEQEEEEKEVNHLQPGVKLALENIHNSNVDKMAKNFAANGFKYGDLIPEKVEE